jgi:Mg2+/Co2+ transporter CorB
LETRTQGMMEEQQGCLVTTQVDDIKESSCSDIASLISLINNTTLQLYQLETSVKNATEISSFEDIYGQIQNLVTLLQQLEEKSCLAQDSVPLDVSGSEMTMLLLLFAYIFLYASIVTRVHR